MFKYEIVIDTKKEYKICPKCGRLYDAKYNFCSQEDEAVSLVPVRFK